MAISCFTVGNHGESTHGHVKDVIGVDSGVKLSGIFFCITVGSIIGGAFSGLVISISRLSLIRLTLSYSTIGDRGESTHVHAGDVIGVDTKVKFSSIFFSVTFGSTVGGAFSGLFISISRLSFIRLTISSLTVGHLGESTHVHARDVIGVDTGAKFSGIGLASGSQFNMSSSSLPSREESRSLIEHFRSSCHAIPFVGRPSSIRAWSTGSPPIH